MTTSKGTSTISSCKTNASLVRKKKNKQIFRRLIFSKITGQAGVASDSYQYTTLLEHGPEMSAVYLSVLLKCSTIELLSERFGLFTADVDVVPNPLLVKKLDYSEVRKKKKFHQKKKIFIKKKHENIPTKRKNPISDLFLTCSNHFFCSLLISSVKKLSISSPAANLSTMAMWCLSIFVIQLISTLIRSPFLRDKAESVELSDLSTGITFMNSCSEFLVRHWESFATKKCIK